MSVKHDHISSFSPMRAKKLPVNNGYRANPCGDVDYDLLYQEVTRKYPKIIARLGE